ncbi:PIN domain-containing protein [Alsobacter sp. R-9]
MRVVDTSAWIEWLVGSASADAVRSMLPTRDRWIVPTLVQHELAKWLLREKGEEAVDEVIAFTMTCRLVPLDTGIALAAATVCRDFRLATADALIYATALDQKADLVTCDGHFEGLPGVHFIRKG